MMGGNNRGAVHEPDPSETDAALGERLKRLLDEDSSLQGEMAQEGVDPSRVLAEATTVLQGVRKDFVTLYQQYEDQVKRVNAYRSSAPSNNKASTADSDAAFGLWALALIANVFFLPTLALLKWSGRLVNVPYRPFLLSIPGLLVVVPIIYSILIRVVKSIASRADSRRRDREALIALQAAENQLDSRLRTLVLTPGLRRSSNPQFASVDELRVEISEALHLGSRIDAQRFVETRAYRRIITNLNREGGAVIGIAGPRGVGKSELIRKFCADPAAATVETGGTIGVLVPAPVAYQPESFLRLLIRRMCESVPEYETYARQTKRPLHGTTAAFSTVAVLFGATLAYWHVVSDVNSRTWGYMVIAVGFSVAYASLAVGAVRRFRRRLRGTSLTQPRLRQGDGARGDFAGNAAHRRELGRRAAGVARRIRYLETQSANTERSLSWRGLGAKINTAATWSQLPLSEADLVAEVQSMVNDMTSSGYNVVIGIDELDKLEAGDTAEAFLNSIKVLFSIRSCSFIVTISESAWVSFARRGLPIRDVFDSSLDTVVVAEHLTFNESRSFIRQRSESMSDAEVLFCHCLSGGLPRDLLRFARGIAEANKELGGHQYLSAAIGRVLLSEWSSRVYATIISLRSQQEPASLPLLAELDRLKESSQDDWHRRVRQFRSSDPWLSRLLSLDGPDHDGVRNAEADSTDEGWAQCRRQIYGYLNFLDTLRAAFAPDGGAYKALAVRSEGSAGIEEDDLIPFGALAEARRRVEVNVVSGWRQTDVARTLLKVASSEAAASLDDQGMLRSHSDQQRKASVSNDLINGAATSEV